MTSVKAKSLPVIAYHYVNNGKAELTTPPACFEEHCRMLAERGWRGVDLAEAEAFLLHGESLPRKSVLITLDDGYLDNYVYAWPILRKYGHKAVIFATAGLVDAAQKDMEASGAGPRPTLEDVWQGSARAGDLPPVDAIFHDSGRGYTRLENLFFSWDEARLMEKSGVVAIAGHSMFHAAVFASPDYDGFSQPRDSLVSFRHEVRGDFWGRPRFSVAAELTGRAFLPDEELLENLRAFVPQDEGGAFEFFKDESNIRGLRGIMDSFAGRLGRMESEEEQRDRIFGAMRDNRAILEKELGHAVRGFCWPWGKYSDLALEAGKAAGFSVFYTVTKGPNPPGRPDRVRRMDCRRNPEILLSRIGIYARPVWGELYEALRRFRLRIRGKGKR